MAPLYRAKSQRSSDGIRLRFSVGHGYVFHVRPYGHRRASGHAPAIHRSIWSDLLYFPGHAVGHMCIPELLCLCFYGEVVRAGVRLELPLCPGHVVVGQPHYVLIGRALVPRHRIGVAICASGNFWLGARGLFLSCQEDSRKP